MDHDGPAVFRTQTSVGSEMIIWYLRVRESQ